RRAADQARDRRTHSGRAVGLRDQGRARRELRGRDPGRAAKERFRAPRVVAADRGNRARGCRDRGRRVALEQTRRAGAHVRSFAERTREPRSRARTAPRRRARAFRRLMWDRIPVAFAAGLVSVVTPCVLPLVPGYLSAISAVEANRLGEPRVARRVVAASLP